MKRWVGLIIALLVTTGSAFWWWQQHPGQSLQLHGHNYQTVIMRTEAEREQGLSGTDSLPDGQAMLFIFPSDGKWGMWMKDMQYPIDMVWLNGNKQVTYLVKNARPSSYPDTIYRSPVSSRYVIELPSGTIERTGIAEGDLATLPSGI